ncbi:RNA-directed DNA polymerase [Roseateles sp. DAIF2]|uniref:reverse transcriptase family protein n=1 Tax=Roseateles sp. DAIF2 TaxID=2714952 RepID=UPI0018A336FD|nr:reverse transcriptase family protein [Roseateles sp. DAIF2]QPF71496.1 RNA-directed DNA polymerase [Roseateles sp. DAIF2]
MSYAFHQSPLYVMRSRRRLADEIFGISLTALEGLVENGNNYIESRRVTGGKERLVRAPKPLLRHIQERLAQLLNRIEAPDYLHSGRKQRSHISNALAHQGATRVLKLDIRKFYPSITRARVWNYFAGQMRCSPDVAALLAKICCFEGSAPIGSPVSQVLALQVVRPMLDEVDVLARAHGLTFTCYVDDLSFSGEKATPAFLWQIKQLIRRHGYRYHGGTAYGPDAERRVTGVLLTAQGPRVPPAHLQGIRAARHAFEAAKEASDREATLSVLIGRLAAAAAIEKRFLAQIGDLRRRRRRFRPPSFGG